MRIGIIFFCLIFSVTVRANALFDAIASTAKAAKDEAFQRFMMIKAVEQLKTLRDNYEASMRYYAMFQKMNAGKGILPNIARRVADIGEDTYRQARLQFEDDWIHNKAYNSDVDQLIEKMDKYASDKIRYAGKVFERSREAEHEAAIISLEADSLDPKTTQRAALKAQALQLQLAAQTNENLAQLLDVNTRLYKLQMEHKQAQIRDSDIFDKSVKILFGKSESASAQRTKE